MYSSRRGAFGADAEQVGWILASHAAVALSSARQAENLVAALAGSRVIGEAIGVVMARYRLTEPAAWDAIVRVSQRRNLKVRVLAETITTIGELPDGP
jgi:AmiR/NasT family two-component response regulator